ncbi:hypothetical protein Aca07nite_68860 [Actinoplanes capillaceus]|uniref:AB hydrolase-1 domain-containing protein n=1 Tax=Actinoplanes campanulatus TaxID=113559 RepID=A0ABQ3WTJ5_9ACTN|nr:alpha/beta fold hydrolase [Actinoplanes capillaceus]GID49611.1 hypothetical protein Aca07nite_68860 [Actinoplanes capillaceus]
MSRSTTPALAGVPEIQLIDFDLVTGPAGPSRLFLHGFGGDKHQLRGLGDALPQASRSMYVSLRAHGDSPRPAWGYSVLDFAADVHRVADLLRPPVDVIAYSYGALVGAACAATWGDGLIRSLVVIDQSFTADPAQHEADEWAEGSYLRWMYRYGRMVELLGIPVHVLAAQHSDMIGREERGRMSAAGIRVTTIPGDHGSCLDDPARLAAVITGRPC